MAGGCGGGFWETVGREGERGFGFGFGAPGWEGGWGRGHGWGVWVDGDGMGEVFEKEGINQYQKD